MTVSEFNTEDFLNQQRVLGTLITWKKNEIESFIGLRVLVYHKCFIFKKHKNNLVVWSFMCISTQSSNVQKLHKNMPIFSLFLELESMPMQLNKMYIDI